MALTRRAILGAGLVAVLHPSRLGAAASVVDLVAGALPGRDGTFGYNGASPGPTLRGAVAKPVKIRFANKLAGPTTLAFPGAQIESGESSFSGLTGSPVASGEVREIAFTPRDAGFNLYLPYGSLAVTDPLSAGLFGPIVIDEANPPPVDLDAVVVFSLDGSGLRANAVSAPLTLSAAPRGRVRIRLANATPDRILGLAVSGAAAQVIAVDGQPSELFTPRDGAFPMAPSSRFELMLELPEAGGRVTFAVRGVGPAVQIETAGEKAQTRPAIAAPPSNPRLPQEIALERAQRITVTLTDAPDKGFAINNAHAKQWPAKPLFKAARGSPVTLTLNNKTSAAQTLRLEGHVARQLHALDDGWDPYWRDALLIGPGKTLHAAFVADNPGKWPLASASPEKRAAGMLSWFLVT